MGNEAVARWIADILEAKGWTHSDLAREAGRAISTITRAGRPDYPFTVTRKTVAGIARASGMPVPPEVEQALDEAAARPAKPRNALKPARSPAPAVERADTVPMRSFGPMPARLSLVKRGEIRVGRPGALAGVGGAFAFHPDDDSLAPAASTRDLLYAAPAHGLHKGDMLVLVTPGGRAHLGYLSAFDEEGYEILQAGGARRVPVGEVAEVASVVLVHRFGRPLCVVWDRSDAA